MTGRISTTALGPKPAGMGLIVDSFADSELLKRAVRNARSRNRRGYHMRWQAVMDVFALGSTFAWQLCTRYGINPEEKVR